MKELDLTTFLNPFSSEKSEIKISINGNIVDTLDKSGLTFPANINAVIAINNEIIPRENWETTFPKDGDQIILRLIPTGGDNGKIILRLVLTAAIIAATWGVGTPGAVGSWAGVGNTMFGAGTWGSFFTNTALTYASMMLVDKIAPLPTASSSRSREDEPKTFGIESTKNRINQWGAVPVLLGRHRFHPPYAAQPYSEIVGDEQYINMLFCVGYYPMLIEDMKLGSTYLDDYITSSITNNDFLTNETNRNIEIYVHENFDRNNTTLKYFKDDIYEETFSSQLNQTDGYIYNTTQANTDEFIVDILAPNGVYGLSSSGKKTVKTVEFEIQYAPTGTDHNNNNAWSVGVAGRVVAANSISVPVPGNSIRRTYNRDDGYSLTSVVGYVHTRVGIDKSSGLIVSYNSGNNSFPTVSEARTRCPNFPGYVAPICSFTRSSLGANQITQLRTTELDRANANDFLPTHGNNNIYIAGGTIYQKPFIAGSSSTTTRRGFRYVTMQNNNRTSGTWDIRCRRITADHDPITDRTYDTIAWVALKSVNSTRHPVDLSGITLIEIRLRASEQFNGVLDDFNVLATTICKDFVSGSTWTERPTNNPAALFRYLLQGPFNKRPVADAKLNLVALATFSDYCTSMGFSFNLYCDYQTSIFDMLISIAASGRSSPTYRDGKYSIITDSPQTTICQHFTPRTSWGFSSSKVFYTPPHAFRVTIADETQDYRTEEVFVYADGYSKTGGNNTTIASLFEEMKLLGVTNYHDAWKHGRFHLAQLLLRPETFKFNVDIENVICTRGDLVRVTHDGPMWGLASGRIKSFPTNLIINDCFEDWEDDPTGAIPNNWLNIYATVSTANRSNTVKLTGQSSARFEYNGTYSYYAQLLMQNITPIMEWGANGNTSQPFANNNAYSNTVYMPTGGMAGKGGFKINEVAGSWLWGVDKFPINNTITDGFLLEATVKNLDPGNGAFYLGVAFYDNNDEEITHPRSFRNQNSITTLYASYTAGQTYVDVVPANATWGNNSVYTIQMGVDLTGNDLPFPILKMSYINSIDTTNNNYWRVSLYQNNSFANNYAAGTRVGQSTAGGSTYCTASYTPVPNNWVTLRGVLLGTNPPFSAPDPRDIRIGSASVKVIGAGHYQNNGVMLVDNIKLKKFTNPTNSLIGQTITFSGWLKVSNNSTSYLIIDSRNGQVTSSYAVANNNWSFVSCSRTITANEKRIEFCVFHNSLSAGPYAYADGLTASLSNNYSTIVLDENVTMTANNNHCIRIRRFDGNSVTGNVTLAVGENNTINVTGIGLNQGIMPGDLFMFGRNNQETVECLVKSVKPTDDLCAEIELMDYSPAVYTAESGTIPAYDTHITGPTLAIAPVIFDVRSDERVMIRRGFIWSCRMLVNFSPRSASALKDINYVEGQFKTAYATMAWIPLPNTPKDTSSIYISDVEQGETYWIRFRYIYKDGHAGPWCPIYSHTVIGKSGYPTDATFDDANCVFEANRITFVINAISDFDLDFYEIRTDANWGVAAGMICQTKGVRYAYTGLLEINDTYYLKARDTSGNYSVNADTISNGAAPDTLDIGTITVDFTSNDCVLTWAQVDYLKFAYYQVTVYSNAGHSTLIYTSIQFTNPTYVFDFATNSGTSGGPYRELWFRVTVHDIYGRTDYSDAYGINAVPAVITDLAAQIGLEMIVVRCGPMYGDIIGYEFGCDTDNPPTTTKAGETNFQAFTSLTAGSNYYCRGRAKDFFGYGNWCNTIIGVPETLTMDAAHMDIPMSNNANFSATTGNTTWSAHQVTWKGNTFNIASGNAGASLFVYWNTSVNNAYNNGNTMPLDGNCWMMCYRSGNNAFPAFQQPIIHGALIQAGTMDANRITAGTLYIGNIVGSTGSLNFTSSGAFSFASSGNFIVSSGNFQVTAANGIYLSGANGVQIAAGSGIQVAGNATTPGLIKIYKNALAGTYFHIGGFNNNFQICPSSNGSETMQFGNTTATWNTINVHASNTLYLSGSVFAELYCSGSTSFVSVASTGVTCIWGTSGVSINGNKANNSISNIPGIWKNTYTGNGSNGRAITGMNSMPKLVWINEIGSEAGTVYTHFCTFQYQSSGNSFSVGHGGTSMYSYSNGIYGNNNNGFLVALSSTGWGPNRNGISYEVVAMY